MGFLKTPILAAGAILLLDACVPKPNRPLAARGLPAEERHGFIIQKGYDTPLEIRQAFVDGRIVQGMDRDLVFQLYGRPDRSREGDAAWEYLDKKGRLITGIKFKNEKVDSIYGDRGGPRDSASR